MKKVININFQGQVIAIEETAYEILNKYIVSLKSYFSREVDGEEIVNDIENRIAELFGNRLKLGINCITDEDVESIISNIGRPEEFDTEYDENKRNDSNDFPSFDESESQVRSLYRNSSDKIIGGVCSGLAHYFKTDPVWFRLAFVVLFTVLFWVYIILWIVLKQKPLETNVGKRLYKNPNDKYIGGVCGGIAAYFKIDSWIPRLVFLLPLFLNVFGMVSIFPLNHLLGSMDFSWNLNGGVVLLYIILMIIVPEAKTVKQKLEMMGEEDYIKPIRERVMPPEPSSSGYTYTTAPAKTNRSGCLNFLIVLLKVGFFAIVGITALAMIAAFAVIFFAGAQLIPIKTLFIDLGFESTLFNLSLICFSYPLLEGL